jgi:hypothetical protein
MSSTTDTAKYTFTLKERPNGVGWWIMLEPNGGNLPILSDGFIGMDLDEEVPEQDARALVNQLNAKVKRVSHTRVVDSV